MIFIFNTFDGADNKCHKIHGRSKSISVCLRWAHKTSLTRHFLLKFLYQASKVRGHVFVC